MGKRTVFISGYGTGSDIDSGICHSYCFAKPECDATSRGRDSNAAAGDTGTKRQDDASGSEYGNQANSNADCCWRQQECGPETYAGLGNRGSFQ